MAPRLEKNLIKFLQYGVSQELGQRAVEAGLTVTKVRTVNLKDIQAKGFEKEEAKTLKASVSRKAIEENVLLSLLDNSNYLCNCCKGDKGQSFIVHHIEEYATSQDNSYENLIVLCPTCHDLAHRSQTQLTLSITPRMLRYNKANWEAEVERKNAERAVRSNDRYISTDRPDEALELPKPKKIQTRIIVLTFEGNADEFHVQKIDSIIESLRQISGNSGIELVSTERGSFLMFIRATSEDKEKIDTPETKGQLLKDHNVVLTSVVDEKSFRQAQIRDDELHRVPRDLLDWSPTLPDGTHFSRPELEQILDGIANQDNTTKAVLGLPGSGKSSLLAELAQELTSKGISVLAIKADLLDPAIETEDDLAAWLGLSISPSAIIWRISQLRPIVLIIDQLDALAGYTDIRTGRLSVLLNLVRRVSGLKNVHVVLSAREFEYKHDARLKVIKAETIHLDLPPWSEVVPVLKRHGYNPEGWPADAQQVLRSPQALNTFLKLEERSKEPPFHKYLLMLDQMWAETITQQPNGSRLARLVTDIAHQMAEKEVLWLPAARFDEHSEDINYLVSAGMLSDLGMAGNKIGFSHQTIFEHALARSFTHTEGRLSEFAIERQMSLFVRPKLWAALTYLREVDPAAYRVEMRTLFHTKGLRLHLRTLLVEFLGQQQAPDDVESRLFDEALTSDRRPAAFMAMTGSSGWFERYKHTEIPRAMKDEKEAILALDVLNPAWLIDPNQVERLILENWAALPNKDNLTSIALRQAQVWTPGLVDIAKTLIARKAIHDHSLEFMISTIGITQPEVALELLMATLDQELHVAKRESAARHTSEPIKNVVKQSNVWDTLEALGKDNPFLFLGALWPWLTEAMSALRGLESSEDGPDYPIKYTLDFRFKEEERGRERSDYPILSAVRVALETLALSYEEQFLAWFSERERDEFSPAQRLFAHVLSLYPDRYAKVAYRFLLDDPRRLTLGNYEDSLGTTKRLIASASSHWSEMEVKTFVSAVNSYAPLPLNDLDVKGRKLFNDRVRRVKLELLEALTVERLPDATRRQVLEERRRFPGSSQRTRHTGPTWIGSPISSEQLAKSRDEEIINAFRHVPDDSEWEHPNRMMEGGNIQLSRAFAEFAKTNPERAVMLIQKFEPHFGTRAAGYTMEAIAEAGDPQIVVTLLTELDQRGFMSEEFRRSATGAIDKLIRRGIKVSSKVLNIIERWLNETTVPFTASAQQGEEQSERDEDVVLDLGWERDTETGPSEWEQGIIWGSGSIGSLPDGNFPALDVLIHALLREEQHDRTVTVIKRAYERGENERIWRAILHWFRYIKPTQKEEVDHLLDGLFKRYPGLLRSHELAILFAHLHWRHPDFVRSYLEIWINTDDEYYQQLAGELTVLIAFLQPILPWTQQLLERVTYDQGTVSSRRGAINSAVNLFPDIKYRERASKLLVDVIPRMSTSDWNNLFDVFRNVDEITPEPSWIALLTAIESNLTGAPKIDATFVVDRLQTLLPHHALLVAKVSRRLIEIWRDELGDIQTSTAVSASEMVDLAITLHRLGDETREIGLELFEQLVEIQAYSAKERLEQIDNRFRSHAPKRQRLPRRKRSSS